jgi:hypothetical protein
MRNGHTTSELSFVGLLREFKTEAQVLIKQEIDLAKAEMSEKISRFGGNITKLAIGGFVAYAGAIVLLIGLGAIVAYAFRALGLSTALADFLGWSIIGLIVIAIGGGMILKTLKAMKHENLKPEKTIETLRHVRGEPDPARAPEAEHPEPPLKLSSDTIKSNIEVTQSVIEDTTEEIAHRLTPRYMGHAFVKSVQNHPVRASIISVGTGLASFLWVKHKRNHH